MAGKGWIVNEKIILKRKKRGKSKLVYVMLSENLGFAYTVSETF